MSIIQINTVFNIELDFEIAPFPKRLAAYCIDFVLMIAYMYLIKYVLYAAMGLYFKDAIGLDILIVSFPMLIYSLVMETVMNGQTLGKKVLSIRVLSMDGGEPGFAQYLLRWITKFFEWPFLFGYVVMDSTNMFIYIIFTGFLGLGAVIAIAATKNTQRLGDLAAGTVVVNTKTDFTVADTVFMEVAESSYTPRYPEVMRLSDNDINTIKTILTQSKKRRQNHIAQRVSTKVQDVLGVKPLDDPEAFLEQLLLDYNYLATKEQA